MATTSDNKYLQNFLFAPNYYAKQAGRKVYDVKNLTREDVKVLVDKVETGLSPENLTCDGELTGNTLKLKTEMLNGALRALKKLEKRF